MAIQNYLSLEETLLGLYLLPSHYVEIVWLFQVPQEPAAVENKPTKMAIGESSLILHDNSSMFGSQ